MLRRSVSPTSLASDAAMQVVTISLILGQVLDESFENNNYNNIEIKIIMKV